MPIRWDNIGQTSGMYNASTLANRSATQQVNKGFDALQGVIDTQQRVSDGNYANTTKNNSAEVTQYLQQLGSQGVEAVENAQSSGAISNFIGQYGGQLNDSTKLLDGTATLSRARSSENAEYQYNQTKYAQASKPLVDEWNGLNSDPSKDAERDAFLEANKSALLASGDYSRMFDKAKATDRTELNQGRLDAEHTTKRTLNQLLLDGNSALIKAKEAGELQQTNDAIEAGILIVDPKTGETISNPNLSQDEISNFYEMRGESHFEQKTERELETEHQKKLLAIPGITSAQLTAGMQAYKQTLENSKYTLTKQEEIELSSQEAANTRNFGSELSDPFYQDPDVDVGAAVFEAFEEGKKNNPILDTATQNSMWSWFNSQDGSQEEFLLGAQEWATKGLKVEGVDEPFIIPPAMLGEMFSFFQDKKTGDETLEDIAQRFVTSRRYEDAKTKSDNRIEAADDLRSRRANMVSGGGRTAGKVGRSIAEYQAKELKNTNLQINSRRENEDRFTALHAEMLAEQEKDSYLQPDATFHDAYSKWSNPENTGPDPQTLRADGTPKDLFGSFLTPEPGQDLAGNPINNDPAPVAAPVANNVSPAPVNNAPASEGISLKSYLPGGENSRVPTSMNALGTELTRTLTESPIGTAAAGMLTNAFQTEKSRAANQGNSIMQAVTTNNGRTINNLLSAATSTKKGLKQIASEAKKLLPEMGLGLDVVDSSIKSGMPKLMDNNVSSLSVTEIASLLTDVGNSKVAPYVQQLQKELALRKNAEESEFTGQLRNFAGGNGSQLYGG